VTNITTQIEQVEGRFAQERLFAMAYSLFGVLALLLACIGLFGLMSYNVSRRTNEIGIRMALGAQRKDVVRMVLSESLLLVAIGVAIGFGVALAAGRLVTSVLFGLSASDIATFVSAIVLMIAVSTLAGYLPARRASRVDPMIALHYE
jgi:ABC-type antimicrobial peptide transport system permease subunit